MLKPVPDSERSVHSRGCINRLTRNMSYPLLPGVQKHRATVLKFAKGSPCPMLVTALGPIRPCVKAVTEKGLRGVVALQCGSNHTERMSTSITMPHRPHGPAKLLWRGPMTRYRAGTRRGDIQWQFIICCACNSANGNTPEELTIHYNHQQSFFRILRCSSFMRLCTVHLCTTDIQSVMEQSMLRLSAAGSQLLTPSQSSHSSIYYQT